MDAIISSFCYSARTLWDFAPDLSDHFDTLRSYEIVYDFTKVDERRIINSSKFFWKLFLKYPPESNSRYPVPYYPTFENPHRTLRACNRRKGKRKKKEDDPTIDNRYRKQRARVYGRFHPTPAEIN